MVKITQSTLTELFSDYVRRLPESYSTRTSFWCRLLEDCYYHGMSEGLLDKPMERFNWFISSILNTHPIKGKDTPPWRTLLASCAMVESQNNGRIMYQSIPKPPIPPRQSPGIWLALSSVQREIWSKMRPARSGIWLSCQNVCQRSEAKGFRNSLIQHVSRVYGSLLLSIPRGFFCCWCQYSCIVEYAFV